MQYDRVYITETPEFGKYKDDNTTKPEREGIMNRKYREKRNIVQKIPQTKPEMFAWAKPYNDPNIDTVPTGLSKQFRYSPIFRNAVADTMVKLTGYRRKDYIIAEQQTGIKHTPTVTVWHHAWDENNGLYRMQLVDFDTHKKSCPHAGGCKLWLLNNNINGSYRSHRRINETGNYTDVATFYEIDARDRNDFQKGYVSKKTCSLVRKKHIQLRGVDMYGNLLYANSKGAYLWDHESDSLIPLKGTISFQN